MYYEIISSSWNPKYCKAIIEALFLFKFYCYIPLNPSKFLMSFLEHIIITSVAFCFTSSNISNVVPFSAQLTLGYINKIIEW